MNQRLPFAVAIVLGLSGGLLLSAPLSALIRPQEHGESSTIGVSNPFAHWIEGVSQDLLLLGTDEGGGNTDVITLLRVEAGVTHITQIPRDAYVESSRWGPRKIKIGRAHV